MKVRSAQLAQSAVYPEQYPPQLGREVVMLGRSNVGKSSLINRLVNRKRLARTSAAPGKTRLINFFLVDVKDEQRSDYQWYLVDLPGYGYAKVSKSDRENWLKMINSYLVRRPEDKLCCLLVDIRHEPSVLDKEMCNILYEAGYSIQIIATKADKIARSTRAKNLAVIAKALEFNAKDIILFSSETGEGRDQLLDFIEQFLFYQPQ